MGGGRTTQWQTWSPRPGKVSLRLIERHNFGNQVQI
jgi:hypothetical protein